MFRHDDHPPDDELLLAIDHELSFRRQAAVEIHLAQCAACRARSAHIEQAEREFVAECARDLRACARTGEPSRARLQLSLRELSERWDRSWVAQLSEAFATRPRWTMAGTGVMAAALLVGMLLPGPPFGGSGTDQPLERDALPVATLTPGATSRLAAENLCGSTNRVRQPIPAAMRRQVLHDYGMEHVPVADYELDYLITPELGGATEARNLWPQRYGSRAWNARVKDQLENLLPSMVCSGQLELQTAQRAIAADWIAAYRKYFKTRQPLEAHARLMADDDEDEQDQRDLPGPTLMTSVSLTMPMVTLTSLSARR